MAVPIETRIAEYMTQHNIGLSPVHEGDGEDFILYIQYGVEPYVELGETQYDGDADSIMPWYEPAEGVSLKRGMQTGLVDKVHRLLRLTKGDILERNDNGKRWKEIFKISDALEDKHFGPLTPTRKKSIMPKAK